MPSLPTENNLTSENSMLASVALVFERSGSEVVRGEQQDLQCWSSTI